MRRQVPLPGPVEEFDQNEKMFCHRQRSLITYKVQKDATTYI